VPCLAAYFGALVGLRIGKPILERYAAGGFLSEKKRKINSKQ